MSRIHYTNVVSDDSGNILAGADFEVRLTSNNALVALYQDRTGLTTISNPGTSDPTSALIDFWIDPGEYILTVGAGASARSFALNLTLPRVFVVGGAGQSNMANSNAQSVGGDLSVDDRILVYDDVGDQLVVWDPANQNGPSSTRRGVGRNNIVFQACKQALASGMYDFCVAGVEADPGETISSWVGTGLTSPSWLTLDAYFSSMFANAEVAALGLTSLGHFIWQQGENEGSGYTVESYAASFDTLKSQLRGTSWFSDDTPIASIELPGADVAGNNYSASNRTNSYIVGRLPYDDDPLTVAARTYNFDDGADNTHWTGTGIDDVGRSAFRALHGYKSGNRAGMTYADGGYKFAMEPTFGRGLGLVAYNEAARTFKMGFADFTSGDDLYIQTPSFLWDAIDETITLSGRLDLADTGLRLFETSGADLSNPASPVNTQRKVRGSLHSVLAGRRLVVSTGSDPASDFDVFYPSSKITPDAINSVEEYLDQIFGPRIDLRALNADSSGTVRAGSFSTDFTDNTLGSETTQLEVLTLDAGVVTFCFRFRPNQALAASGTVLAPGLSFISDADTGIARTANNTLNIVTGGVSAIAISDTQNVGFGTQTPGTKVNARRLSASVQGADDFAENVLRIEHEYSNGVGTRRAIDFQIRNDFTAGNIQGRSNGTLTGSSDIHFQMDGGRTKFFGGGINIGQTQGNSPLSVAGLPTSATGLVSGDVWNNSGVLNIVP